MSVDPAVEQNIVAGPAPVAGPGSAPEPTNPVDALRAEVAAEETANPEGWAEVPLGDATVRILSPLDWRSSAHAALQSGDFESWAELCLAPGDYDNVWVQLDPTLREINEMFDAWSRITGQGSAGKSQNLRRSLRRMAGR